MDHRNVQSPSEFYDWADEYLEKSEESTDPDEKVSLAEIVYKKASEILPWLERKSYRINYIDQLLAYGTHMKIAIGDRLRASSVFERALAVDDDLPIAHYRLGHIGFQKDNFASAVFHFEKSLKRSKTSKYNLEKFQEGHAIKLLAYSCLKLFDTYKTHALKSDEYKDLDPFIASYLVNKRDQDKPIVWSRFKLGTTLKSTRITHTKYLELKGLVDQDKTYAYIDKYTDWPTIGYNGRDMGISIVILNTLMNIIAKDYSEFEIRVHNTNNQQIRRLRNYLADMGLEPPDFEISNANRNPAITASPEIFIFKRIED